MIRVAPGRACPQCAGTLDVETCRHGAAESASQLAWHTAVAYRDERRRGAGRPSKNSPRVGYSRDEIVERVPHLTASIYDEAVALDDWLEPDDPRRADLAAGAITVGTTYESVRRERRDADLHLQARALPDGRYDVIVADPPWAYDDDGPGRRGAAADHYPTMSLDALIAMRASILSIAADDAMLVLCATSPLLPDALRLMAAWGFGYVSSAVWHKTGRMGMGSIFRIDHEFILIGRRGEGVPVAAHDVRSVIAAPYAGHSRKPDAIYEAIERLWPHARRIELFARRARPGWDRWGAESPPNDDDPDGGGGGAAQPEPPPQLEPQPELPRAIAVPVADIRNRLFIQSSESMRQIPDRSIQLALTSPPYYGQIDYGCEGQIGLEDDPREYIARLVRVFCELHRVVMDDGSAFIIVDDTYHGDSQPRRSSGETRAKVWDPSLSRGNGGTRRSAARIGTWRPRTLVGIPGMIEEALRETDWIVRDRIIWAKPHARTNPRVRNRCTPAYEFVLHVAKSEHYYADADELRKHTNVWTIPVGGSRLHPATFPEELAERCIRIGSRPGDIVLDPFLGSGTTAVVAERLGRIWVGYELNPAYQQIVERRRAEHSPKGSDAA